jgi:hypothetical protein
MDNRSSLGTVSIENSMQSVFGGRLALAVNDIAVKVHNDNVLRSSVKIAKA